MFRARQLALIFPLFLPLYFLRTPFFPTTALEILFFITVISISLQEGLTPWLTGWKKIKPWYWPIGLWLLASFIGIFIAPNHLAALGLWRAYILEPIIFFILLSGIIKDQSDRHRLIKSFCIISILIALWCVLQFAGLLPIPHPWDVALNLRRATGPFPFPNAVALFCAPIAALCFGLFFQPTPATSSDKFFPLFLYLGFTAATLATLLAKSIGGSLAIIICAVLVLITNSKTRKLALGFCLISIFAIALIPSLRSPIINVLSFKLWSGQVRLTIYSETLAMLKDHPLFGAGFGAYPTVIVPYHTATYLEIFQYPHNMILNLWTETGLLGLVAFFLICVTWFKQSHASSNQPNKLTSYDASIFPLLALLIHGLVDVPYFKNDLAFAFWIFAALTLAHIKMIDENKKH